MKIMELKSTGMVSYSTTPWRAYGAPPKIYAKGQQQSQLSYAEKKHNFEGTVFF